MKKYILALIGIILFCTGSLFSQDFETTLNPYTGDLQLYNNEVSTTALTGYVQKTGDDMSGDLVVDANIAIGTTTATERLHVNEGNILITNADKESSFTMSDSTGTPDVILNTFGDTYFNGSGNVGIGTTTPEGLLDINGSENHYIVSIDTDVYTVATTDYIVSIATTTSVSATVTIPTSIISTEGRILIFKDEDGNASTNNITIGTEGSEKIDGEDTFVINADFGSVSLYSKDNNLYVY